MEILNNRYVLAVHDLAVSSAFYQKALGFQEYFNNGDWCFVRRDKCIIMMGRCWDAAPAGTLGDHSYFAYLEVDAIDELYRHCTVENVKFISAPTNQPWGMREFGLRTPDGHRIMIGQKL